MGVRKPLLGAVAAAMAATVSAPAAAASLRLGDYDAADAHLLMTFHGTNLITTNLGRWHLTLVEAGVEGVPLPPSAP